MNTGRTGETNNSAQAIKKRGRAPIVDVRTLVHLQPEGTHCRCRICSQTLIFVSGNVRRHYKHFHPQHISIPYRLSDPFVQSSI